MTIGERIRALRKERGMTQDAAALALDVTRQAVAKWEGNQTAPSTANIMKLAELFQVSFQDLLFGAQDFIWTWALKHHVIPLTCLFVCSLRAFDTELLGRRALRDGRSFRRRGIFGCRPKTCLPSWR
jgi:transcriptional regulator with XRE-family HTH domain